jgi:hypothetical protein
MAFMFVIFVIIASFFLLVTLIMIIKRPKDKYLTNVCHPNDFGGCN